MFTLDPKITELKVKEKNITKIFFSMNVHQVATPEMSLENARSYVLFFREGKGKVSAHIALHLLATDRKLYYSHSSNPFPEDDLEAIEDEARGFAEGLGAMLDELDFSKLSDAEQNNWIDSQDIFSNKPKSETRLADKPASMPPVAHQAQPAPAQTTPQASKEALASPQAVLAAIQPNHPAPPVSPRQPESATAKQQQKPALQSVPPDIAKPSKPSETRQSSAAVQVVSRDREALARLLTSF